MRRKLRTPIEDRERGIALIMVIGIGAVITAFIATAIVFTVAGSRQARVDADWNGALAAAYAGVEEYQSRLSANPEYVLSGNPEAPFSDGSPITLPEVVNPAFDVGVGGSWATVPGSGDTARFRYEVDTSQFRSDSVLRLRATGAVGQETRTIVADLRQSAFVHYLYFTDLEIQDPEVTVGANGTRTVPPECLRYEWSGRPESGCGPMIQFGESDDIDGQVHTNDVLHACGATFQQRVTTAWNPSGDARWVSECSYPQTEFEAPDPARGGPFHQPQLNMPETNTQIRAAAIDFGCVYTGPTSITMRSDGWMTVRSPSTVQTRPGVAVHTPPECGVPGSGTGGLGHRDGARVRVPDNGAIYIQNVPVSGDPNANDNPVTCRSTGNGIGYPTANEQPPAAVAGIDPYGCRSGDLFVQGMVNGEVTLAAENFVYIVGDIKYVSQDDDLLGLIGNNMVYVRNPAIRSDCEWWGGGCTIRTQTSARTIHAAILSLRSFAVQNTIERGNARQQLTVYGSIAQGFRGVVAQNSGYNKDYNYDPRLQFRSPPHYLSPVTSAYGVTTWIETSAAFNADGTER